VETYSAPNWTPAIPSDAFTFLKNAFRDTAFKASQVYAIWQVSAPPPVPVFSTPVMLGLLALPTGTGLINTLSGKADSRR
jgi:hypothetical protein